MLKFSSFFYKSYCPGEEAALGIIVVSLTCTAYLYGALIVFSIFRLGVKTFFIINMGVPHA